MRRDVKYIRFHVSIVDFFVINGSKKNLFCTLQDILEKINFETTIMKTPEEANIYFAKRMRVKACETGSIPTVLWLVCVPPGWCDQGWHCDHNTRSHSPVSPLSKLSLMYLYYTLLTVTVTLSILTTIILILSFSLLLDKVGKYELDRYVQT